MHVTRDSALRHILLHLEAINGLRSSLFQYLLFYTRTGNSTRRFAKQASPALSAVLVLQAFQGGFRLNCSQFVNPPLSLFVSYFAFPECHSRDDDPIVVTYTKVRTHEACGMQRRSDHRQLSKIVRLIVKFGNRERVKRSRT